MKISAFLYCALMFGGLFFRVHAQELRVVTRQELDKQIKTPQEVLTIFNFWASWCGPCIKEIPLFEEADALENVKVYLVSLDFPEQLEKVKKFVSKRKIRSEVWVLDEKDPNTYISKISKDWSGAIPATLFVRNDGETFFFEKAFKEDELNATINDFLN